MKMLRLPSYFPFLPSHYPITLPTSKPYCLPPVLALPIATRPVSPFPFPSPFPYPYPFFSFHFPCSHPPISRLLVTTGSTSPPLTLPPASFPDQLLLLSSSFLFPFPSSTLLVLLHIHMAAGSTSLQPPLAAG